MRYFNVESLFKINIATEDMSKSYDTLIVLFFLNL